LERFTNFAGPQTEFHFFGWVADSVPGVANWKPRFRDMFYGERMIETTMRVGEGYEMSEEVSVSKAGMSCTKPGESNF